MGTAASSRSGNDVRNTIPVDIADGDVYAAGECRGIGVEVRNHCPAVTAKNADVWPAAGPSRGDDVWNSIGIKEARRHAARHR